MLLSNYTIGGKQLVASGISRLRELTKNINAKSMFTRNLPLAGHSAALFYLVVFLVGRKWRL
jgi:hypothetical protein